MDFRKILPLCLLAFSLIISSCRKDDDDSAIDEQLNTALLAASDGVGKSYYTMPASNDLSAIPQDPNNPLTTAKIELGKLLYHETGIGISPMDNSNTGEFSCASCHFASAGFQANRFQGISEGGQGFGINGEGREKDPSFDEEMMDVQPVRTPSSMNNVYQTNLLWNGQFGATGVNTGTDAYWTEDTPKEVNELGFEGLETQAIAGLAVHRMDVDALPNILENLGYKAMFDAAFSDFPETERYTTITTGLAIAAFERTLFSNESPFQRYLHGDNDAMTEQEKRGAILFFEDANCASCHNGPGLNNMEFHAIGLKDLHECPEEVFKTSVDDLEHLGRGGFTGQAEDMYKFKVPQLYNMKDSPFLGHGASFRPIRAMIEYKNLAVPENSNVPVSQLAEEFVPLNLTDAQIDDIVAFLGEALYDPNLKRYEPESLPSGNCFPFNDPQARIDLGCD